MNPSSAVSVVSYKYNLSSESEETKVSDLHLQVCSAGSCTSSISLKSSEVEDSVKKFANY